jgi:hypothetical protein
MIDALFLTWARYFFLLKNDQTNPRGLIFKGYQGLFAGNKVAVL